MRPVTAYCVGVDWSTRRIDVCAVPLDEDIPGAPVFLHALVAGSALDQASRARAAGRVLARLLTGIENATGGDVVSVAIEHPVGKGQHIMLPLLGALSAAVQVSVTVAWLRPVAWRSELGLERDGDWKQASIVYATRHTNEALDEHSADALCVALAWRSIQSRGSA